MKTVIEHSNFTKKADKAWSIDERLEFISYIAENPLAGDVIPNAEGVRKIRWSIRSAGKRGGVRVIYFNVDADLLVLLDMYKKSKQENITAKNIKVIKNG